MLKAGQPLNELARSDLTAPVSNVGIKLWLNPCCFRFLDGRIDFDFRMVGAVAVQGHAHMLRHACYAASAADEPLRVVNPIGMAPACVVSYTAANR